MKAIRLAWLELRRSRPRGLVPVLLVLVPLLFGSVYLWSNWDPYHRLDAVPVALVNSDRPVEREGTRVAAGEQLVNQLSTTGLFDWHTVGPKEARHGLENGRFYFTIEVPKDFSGKLANATADPQRPTLRITGNDANGYLAGIMAETVLPDLRNQVDAATHATYARALFGELDEVRKQLDLAATSSDELVNGTDLGKKSASTLVDGLDGVNDGVGDVARGAQRVSEATARLDNQIGSATRFTTEELPAAVNGLVDASGVAVNSLSAIKTATGFLLDRANDGLGTLQAIGQRHPPVDQDPVYQQAVDNARQLAGAAASADGQAQRALDASHNASTRATTLQDDIGPLRQNISEINRSTDGLRAGNAQVSGGTDRLSSTVHALTSGSSVLQGGADRVHDGAKKVDELLKGSLDRMPPTNPAEIARTAEMLGSSSEIKPANLNPAEVYGRGLAPLFVSIALAAFGLIAYLRLKPVNPRALAGGTSAGTLAIAGLLPAAVLGVLGAMGLFAVLYFGLGLAPEHLLLTIGLICLAALAFVAIDHFLRVAFGAAGSVVSLVLLVVQITASGGLYPLETGPRVMQVLHPAMPMSYLVDGLRVTISGGLTEHLLRDVAVLGGILVVLPILTALIVRSHRTWTPGRLHPLPH